LQFSTFSLNKQGYSALGKVQENIQTHPKEGNSRGRGVSKAKILIGF